MIRLHFIGAILLTVFMAAATHQANAELRICNDDHTKRSIAIVYKKEGSWTSEGWWTISAGKCQTLVKGDLTKRYYYFRATYGGEAVQAGKYRFCLTPKKFTIKGEQNCKSRGYEDALFAVIDTGKKAKSFTYRIKTKPDAKDEEQAPAISQSNQTQTKPAFVRGSLGEPYTVTGIMQGCEDKDGKTYCAYHAEGWKHFAYEGGGTPQSILDDLARIGPGTELTFEGDMISFGDITADVAVAKYSFSNHLPHAELREKMQGYWYSSADDGAYMLIEGAEQKDIYDANLAGHYYVRWLDKCEGSRGLGPVLQTIDPENRDNPQCYFIQSVTDKTLTLIFVGGNGQYLEFNRNN